MGVYRHTGTLVLCEQTVREQAVRRGRRLQRSGCVRVQPGMSGDGPATSDVVPSILLVACSAFFAHFSCFSSHV
jgi:hypothetical protein